MSSNEYMRKYMLERYYRRVKEARGILGDKCAKCSAVEKLEFDHIEPSRKSFTLTKYLATCSRQKFYDELRKCQLLCETCHKAKTLEDMGWSKSYIVTLHCAYCGGPVLRETRNIRNGQADFYCNQKCTAYHYGNGRPKKLGPIAQLARAGRS